jgi:hypothetical protein
MLQCKCMNSVTKITLNAEMQVQTGSDGCYCNCPSNAPEVNNAVILEHYLGWGRKRSI